MPKSKKRNARNTSSNKVKYNPWLIVGGIILVIVVIVLILMSGKKEVPSQENNDDSSNTPVQKSAEELFRDECLNKFSKMGISNSFVNSYYITSKVEAESWTNEVLPTIYPAKPGFNISKFYYASYVVAVKYPIVLYIKDDPMSGIMKKTVYICQQDKVFASYAQNLPLS